MSLFSKISTPIIALGLLSLTMLTACHSAKTAQKSQPVRSDAKEMTINPTATPSLDAYASNWDKVKIPVTLRLNSPKSVSVSGTAIFERNKSILISLRFFGMEIGNLYFTTDTLIAIDKINRKYVNESISQLLDGCPASVSDIQDLLLGRPFVIGEIFKATEVKDYFDTEFSESSSTYTLIPRSMPKGLEYGFAVDALNALTGLILKVGNHSPVTVNYDNTITTKFGPIAGVTAVNLYAGKSYIDATLEWNVNKASWNDDVKLREISVPNNYQRINASQLIKVFTSL